jgi:hypothetical protein
MDKQLLRALDNLSESLEMIAQVLASKSEEGQSSTTTALQSGDFSKTIGEINIGVKNIKVDTEKILKNQQTIIDLQKKKESDKKTGVAEDVGVSKDQENNIKKGVGTIMLIALAVLAIGLAFKLVGDVNFLAVVGLSLAIVLISIAFEKVSKLGLTIKESFITSAVMVIMAAAVTASSWILSGIKPLTLMQSITGVLIGAMFYFLLPAAASMIKAMESEQEVEFGGMKIKTKGLKISTVLAGAFALPLIMIGISIGITAASWILSGIKPISIMQALTAIAIGFVFSLLAPVVSSIISGITSEGEGSIPGMGGFKKKGVSWESAIVAAFAIPIIMVGMSLAIVASSYILGLVKPVGFMQLLTTIAISAVFTVLAYGLSKIVSALGKMDPMTAAITAVIIPIVFIALSYAMMVSSGYFAGIQTISFGQFLTTLAISVIFVVLSFAVMIISKALGGLTPERAVTVSLIAVGLFVALSFALMLSSAILSKVTPVDYGLLFNIVVMTIAITLSTVVFALGIWVLSKLGFTTPGGAVRFLIGAGLTLVVAGTIMLSSLILGLGNYGKYPSLDWTLGVGASFVAFTIALVALGAIAMTGVGAAAFFLGIPMVLAMSGTILAVSKILAKGDYNLPGFLDWGKGVALLFKTFTPILLILGAIGLANAVVSFFGPNPWKMAQRMILDIAKTIVGVSFILAKGNWQKGPTEEWAKGVAISIGAFSQVYGMLVRSKAVKELKDVGPKEFTEAIKTVIKGIVAAAEELSAAKVAFDNPPPEKWARGVGLAISAFAPVYKGLMLAGFTGKEDFGPESMVKGVKTMTLGIIAAAEEFSNSSAVFEEGKYPTTSWGKGVGAALKAFSPVFESLQEKSWWQSGDDVINNMVKSVKKISESIVYSAKKFSGVSPEMWEAYPKLEWARSVHDVVKRFLMTIEVINKNEDLYNDIYKVASLRDSMIRLAKKLYFNRKYFEDTDYIDSFNRKVISTSSGILIKYHKLNRMLRIGSKSLYGSFGESPATRTARSLVRMARILHSGKESFALDIDPNYMKNVGQNMLDFNELVKKLVESESEGSSLFGRMGESISSLFGLDPISQIANRMVKLAKGYDAMATALIKLSTAMRMLNVNSGAQLGGFTKSLISGEGVKTGGEFTKGEKQMTKINVGGRSESGAKLTKDEQKKNSILYVSEKLEELITIMQNINKNTEVVDEAMEILTDSKVRAAPNLETM